MTITPPAKRTLHSQFQSFLLVGLFLFFVGHFLLLSPSGLEEDFGGIRVVEPQNLLAFLKNEPKTALKDVPTGEVPTYSLKDSIVYDSVGEKPNFKLITSRSNFFQKDGLIHALEVQAAFSDGTLVHANEGVFFHLKDQANLYGAVHTEFANGAIVDSEFATVLMKPVTQIQIPVAETVHGLKEEENSTTRFTSQGLNYIDSPPKVLHLLSQVHVQIEDEKLTHIYSDDAVYEHDNGHLHFAMRTNRPLTEQFVKANQPDLDMKSRTLDVEIAEGEGLNRIIAVGDVWIKDSRDPLKISTSTSGKAIFDEPKNDLFLTEFPQVYQDNDTITGDVIIFHRATDQIEVKQSNAIYNNDSH